MLHGYCYNYARLVPAIRPSSRTLTTTPYSSLFRPHRLSAAAAATTISSTVASYTTARTPTPTPTPTTLRTTRLPSNRTAISATTLSKPLADSTTTVQPYSSSDTLNPPASTLPPPLTLPPPRQPHESLFSYLIALGKGYVVFYKSGIRAIYHNWKWTRQVRARIAAGPYRQRRQIDDEVLLRSGTLSRAEFHLLRRTRQDIRKIPLFVLMYIVCGEFTPLIVVALSGLVPRTVWIPKQVLRARERAESRRAAVYATALSESEPETSMNYEARRLGSILNVYPVWWDRLPVTPSWFISRRVAERLRLIDLDDFAIVQDGSQGDGVQRLADLEEVRLAAEMRGLDVLGRKDEELKAMLGKWIRARKNGRSAKEMVLKGSKWWAGN